MHAIAGDLAVRLREPAESAKLFNTANAQSEAAGGFVTNPESSFAGGFGSLALFYGVMSRSLGDQGLGRIADRYLSEVADHTSRTTGNLGLYHNASAASLRLIVGTLAAKSTKRYAGLLSALDHIVIEQADHLIGIGASSPTSERTLDLISGTCGLTAALLTGPRTNNTAGAVRRVIADLAVRALQPHLRGYWVPSSLISVVDSADYPDGYINTGMAHGVAGALALISIAVTEGVRADGDLDAIDVLAEWLVEHRADDQWGPNWRIGISGAGGGPTSHSGWCYGPAGIAAAFRLAGVTRSSDRYIAVASDTLKGIARRPPAERRLGDGGLCHGKAGLATVLRAHLDHDYDRGLAEFLVATVSETVDSFSAEAPVGFRAAKMGVLVDDPGFLTGATGVTLGLVSAVDPSVPQGWARALLLR